MKTFHLSVFESCVDNAISAVTFNVTLCQKLALTKIIPIHHRLNLLIVLYGIKLQLAKTGKGPVLDVMLLSRFRHVTRSPLQSWKWQLIVMS